MEAMHGHEFSAGHPRCWGCLADCGAGAIAATLPQAWGWMPRGIRSASFWTGTGRRATCRARPVRTLARGVLARIAGKRILARLSVFRPVSLWRPRWRSQWRDKPKTGVPLPASLSFFHPCGGLYDIFYHTIIKIAISRNKAISCDRECAPYGRELRRGVF